MNIQKELDSLEESVIETVQFDFLYKKIMFNVRPFNNDLVKLIFHDVSSYYFLKAYGKFRFNISEPDPGDYTELTAIGFSENGFGKFIFESEKFGRAIFEDSDKYHLEPLYSSANFALEIWASYLFIEASGITIGDKYFEVGRPKKYNY